MNIFLVTCAIKELDNKTATRPKEIVYFIPVINISNKRRNKSRLYENNNTKEQRPFIINVHHMWVYFKWASNKFVKRMVYQQLPLYTSSLDHHSYHFLNSLKALIYNFYMTNFKKPTKFYHYIKIQCMRIEGKSAKVVSTKWNRYLHSR